MPIRTYAFRYGSRSLHQHKLANTDVAGKLHGLATSIASNEAANEKSDEASQPNAVSLALPTYIIWGSNTGVGKTLVSAGIAKSAADAQVRSV